MAAPHEFWAVPVICFAASLLPAQDLTPRAYAIAPVGSNAITLSYSLFDGSAITDPTLPIKDFEARFHMQVLSYYRSFSFLGRSANIVGALPYVAGNFRAKVAGDDTHVYRSGMADIRFRMSVNLRGGPAMPLKQFMEWYERTTLGASLTVNVPTGQYDPARLINPGLNRWGVKPELGFSRRFGRWTVDLYGGAWFFAANSRFYPGSSTRAQSPIGAGEAHLVRYLTRRCWVSFDANFWSGGRTVVGGVKNSDYQRNSRLGATFALPVSRRQTVKFSYSGGAYISVGGDYRNLSVAWQYSWLDARR